MPATRHVTQILDQEFLVLRAKLLELGAGLDRLARAEGDQTADARYQQLQTAFSSCKSSVTIMPNSYS